VSAAPAAPAAAAPAAAPGFEAMASQHWGASIRDSPLYGVLAAEQASYVALYGATLHEIEEQ